MFGIFEKTAKAALDVAGDTFDMVTGESDGPTRQDVAKLIDAGLTVAAIAHGYGVAEDVIEALKE